jgi:hypothetical protein
MFLSHGFQAFLTKPIELSLLDAAIREWVRDKNRDDAEAQAAIMPDAKTPPRIVSFTIDGLDLHKGLEHFRDEKSYIRVLRSYTANTHSLLDIVRKATDEPAAFQSDPSLYGITVHGIKGSSYSIFAQITGEKAEALEKASNAGDFDFVSANNREFIGIVEKLLADIDAMLGKISAETPKPRKEKPDTKVLNSLLEACMVYDIINVERAIAELESYEYDSEGDIVPWLWENVHQFNLDEIVERLGENK